MGINRQNINDIASFGIAAGTGALAATLLRGPAGPAGAAIGAIIGARAGRLFSVLLDKVFTKDTDVKRIAAIVAELAVAFLVNAAFLMWETQALTFVGSCAVVATTIGLQLALIPTVDWIASIGFKIKGAFAQ